MESDSSKLESKKVRYGVISILCLMMVGCGLSEKELAAKAHSEETSHLNTALKNVTSSPEQVKYIAALVRHTKNNRLMIPDHLNLTELSDDFFDDMEHVTEFHLGFNRLSSLPESLSKLKNLRLLWIYGNSFTAIPEPVFGLKTLESLIIFQGNIKHISGHINNLKSLVTLDLSSNKLSTLPDDLRGLEQLKLLRLENNKFKTLPKSVASPPNLQALLVGFNKELESLPKVLGNMKELRALSAKHSGLRHIPKELGKLKKLEVLELYSTPLTNLPASIASLPKLSGVFESKSIPSSDLKRMLNSAWNGAPNGIHMENNDVSALDLAFCNVTIHTHDQDATVKIFKQRCEEGNKPNRISKIRDRQRL